MGVSGLGYVALDVTEMSAWTGLMTTVFGMEALRRPKGRAVDLRLDELHHRFTLYPAKRDRVAAIGWEVATVDTLHALAEALRTHGLEVTRGSAADCAERKVTLLYRFHEPHLGACTEIFHGPLACNTPFNPSRGIAGYNTGALGLGHIVYWVKDLPAAIAFYRELMGFEISDYIAWDDNDAVFMHCNPRHHTLALFAEGPGHPGGTLNHIMLEALALDDVGYGWDIVRAQQIPLMFEFGKHTNDHMQSFYLQTPSGFGLEYGYGGRLIGPDWQVRTYDRPMLWGHRKVL